MLRFVLLVPVICILAACASKGDKVVRCGNDVYAISSAPDHPFGNYLKTARKVAVTQATEFCQDKGKKVMVIAVGDTLPVHVRFRCLKEGDPELERSVYKTMTPNKNICVN